jgi:hypothetical protein
MSDSGVDTAANSNPNNSQTPDTLLPVFPTKMPGAGLIIVIVFL